MAYQPVPQGGYPPQQGGYPPPQNGYPPPQQGGYPPPQGGYPPPQQGGYPPPPPGYPPPQNGCPPPSTGPNKCLLAFLIIFFVGFIAVLMKNGGKCNKDVWLNVLLEITVFGAMIHAIWFCFCKD